MSGEVVPDVRAEAGGPPADCPPPRTGVGSIDDVVQRLADLPDAPLSEHHDRLAEAQSVLHDALHPEPTSSDPETTGQRDRDRPARP